MTLVLVEAATVILYISPIEAHSPFDFLSIQFSICFRYVHIPKAWVDLKAPKSEQFPGGVSTGSEDCRYLPGHGHALECVEVWALKVYGAGFRAEGKSVLLICTQSEFRV